MKGQDHPAEKSSKSPASLLKKLLFISIAVIVVAIVVLQLLGRSLFSFSQAGNQNIDNPETLVIMPLGNSITYGNYHPEPRPEGLITGYRQTLWLMLKEAGYDVDFVGNVVAGQDATPSFDPDNEGHPGWTDDQIEANVYKWLKKTPADYIILHIGTNGLNPDPSDVEGILDEIDRYENDYGKHIKVIMAKIINRNIYSQLTTEFNFNIEKMAYDRIRTMGDDLVVIDMEFETGINYDLYTHDGEMFDNLHPYVGGHQKMAVRWFEILKKILPKPEGRPFFVSEPNPVVVLGDEFDYQAVATSNSVPAFRLIESPDGMEINDESGLIAWKPEKEGNYPVILIAENTFGVDTQKFEIRVRPVDLRASSGLIALYDYREGSGNLVHDVSGTGLPLDLYINFEGNVIWDDEQGLEITRNAILTASGNNTKIVDSLRSTNEVTIELWLRTGNIEQNGPAHIVTVSDPLSNGITISQEHDYEADSARYYYTCYLQASGPFSGTTPAFVPEDRYSKFGLQHIAFTRNVNGEERLFINGEPIGTSMNSGTFSLWENTYDLSLGNGFGFDNAWTGKLFLTALYNRALTEEEIVRNHHAGYSGFGPMNPVLPATPGTLNSMALSAVAAKLSLENSETDNSGYVIERKEGQGLYHYIDIIPAGMAEYTDTDLEANKQYTYRIKAINNFGESSYSNEAVVKTFKDDYLSNIALEKHATQSSKTYRGAASRAVDGNTDGAYGNGSVTHTAYELNAWWELDLGDVYNINYLEVWNRTDICCKDRMARFYVMISEEPFESYDFQETLNQQDVWYGYQEYYPEPMVTFNVSGKGRYVRLQLSDSEEICLAEMIVMGNRHLNAPKFSTIPVSEAETNRTYHYSFQASDLDGDSLVYSISHKPAWLSFDPVNQSITGTPSDADAGSYEIAISAYDGLHEVQQAFSIEVLRNTIP